MPTHNDFGFYALLLSGVLGALLADPFGSAMRTALRRARLNDRR
jgi:hypothetical protein